MLYNAPTGSTDPLAPYVGKNVAAGIQGSRIPPGAAEQPQRELCAIIDAGQRAGLPAQSGTDLQQALKAIRSNLLGRFPATGGADGMAILPNPALPALIEGMQFRLKVPGGSANVTTTPTLTVNGLSAPILRADGAAVAAGDLVPGRIREFEIDAAGNARVVGALASEITSTIIASPYAGARTVVPLTSTQTWTVPANVYFLKRVRAWAPGGGGGGSIGSGSGGSGGAGGGYSEKFNIPVTPGQQIPVTIPAGGLGGGTGNGASGGTTSFGAFFSATGGGYGSAGNNGIQNTTAGFGGQGVNGDFNVTATNGSYAYLIGSTPASGIGGSAPFGGASPTPNFASAGNNGNYPGGGGNGGSQGGAGGNGAAGLVIIEY